MLALFTLSAGAQKKMKEPKRPGIGKGADTNDPNAYYLWGVSQLERYPEDAADAFYWSIRLNPSWADAYYARWVALHLSEPDRWVAYEKEDSKTLRSPEVRQIDSLRLRADQLNPFLYRKFDRVMLQHFLQTAIQRQNPGIDQAELSDAIRDYLAKGGFEVKAENAYINGNFPFALQEWAAAMPGWNNKSFVHAERGRIFYMLGAYDSAAAEMSDAVKSFRKSDKDDLVYIYQSKALYEQSLGMTFEKQSNMDAAREAYGRALAEDLSYAPAHLRLSAIDMAKGDTVGALSEMDIATQVQPSDGAIAFLYGYALIQAGHDAEAMEQLKRAAALEPYYAAPVVLMALVYDASDMKEEAAASYNAYIKLASQRDPQLARAKTRLAALSATAPTAPAATPPTPPKP
jgi:tetratricopeptide (TPR) repeat protein